MPWPLGIFDVLAGIFGRWRWGYRLELGHNQQQNGDALFSYGTIFTFKSLKKATKNFSSLFGKGGFTSCYKVTLENGTILAVKVLIKYRYREENFSLMRTMSRISHRNVVELLGYCLEGNHILVYEFVGEYDLNSLLFSNEGENQSELSWPRRASICLGDARGIEYLHRGINPGVNHCDIQPSNVHLDRYFNPKIADFERAHPVNESLSAIVISPIAAYGYMAPDYKVNVILTEKIDAYSFGVLLLETVTRRRHLGFRRERSMVNWVWRLLEWSDYGDCSSETI